jgi:hypothetical protein
MNLLRSLARLALAVSFASVASAAPAPDHTLFPQVLATRVRDGRVDYVALKSDARLPHYLAQLGATDPATLATEADRLAFWLNAYNAYTLQLIIEKHPAKSITEIGKGGFVLDQVFKTTA